MEHVVISKHRKAKYKLNEKGETVIANPKSAGTERRWKINGQDLYSGMHHFLRSKVIKSMKKYLYEYFRDMPPVKNYPICIEMTIKNVSGVKDSKGVLKKSWDLGNQEFIWFKCFEDALCGNVEFIPEKQGKRTIFKPDYTKYPPKIEDDSVVFVNKRICNFKEVQSTEDRELIFTIHQPKDKT